VFHQKGSLFALIVMLLGYIKPTKLSPPHSICDSRILDKYIKEAKEAENAMVCHCSIHFTVYSVKRFETSKRHEKRYIKCKDYYYYYILESALRRLNDVIRPVSKKPARIISCVKTAMKRVSDLSVVLACLFVSRQVERILSPVRKATVYYHSLLSVS
uniref:Erythropoietin n=1 Tax=Callorhinchus milii TaxID=7868 RepID=A0A4W3HFL5_CALMI